MEDKGRTKSSRYEMKYVHDVTSKNWPAKRTPTPRSLSSQKRSRRRRRERASCARSVHSPTNAPAPLQAPNSHGNVVRPAWRRTT